MSTEHQITKRAADGTLTVPELRQFLDELDKAASSPEPGVTVSASGLRPKVRASFGGGIKSITVTIPGESEQR